MTGSAPLQRTPGGVPPILARPTDYPNRPVTTPLGPEPMPGPPAAGNVQQQRLAVLDSLIRSPNVSEETREWAQLVRKAILGN